MAFSVSIVVIFVEPSLCKGHIFRLNISECRITVFCAKMLSLYHIAISWQLNNSYFKLCFILVIDSYCIFLTIKLLNPPSKGKLLLIHTCLFKNNHKCYPSRFDSRTRWNNFIIQPLDIHIYSPSENVSCDSFRLWQSLLLHPLWHGSKVCLQLLVLYHRYDCLLII